MNSTETEYEVFNQYLRERGLKMTTPREKVLQAFLEHEGHLSTDDVLAASRKLDPSIGQATVFRTMKLLEDAGLARDASQDNGPKKYEHAFRHAHHDHLLCTKCGRVVEFYDPQIEKAQKRIFAKFGFTETGHWMELHGLCPECARQSADERQSAGDQKK